MMNEIVNNIKAMQLIERGANEDYELYKDDASGAMFEIDYDGDKITLIAEIDEDYEVIDVLYKA